MADSNFMGVHRPILNSIPAYSLQQNRVYQNVLGCDYKENAPKPYCNVGEQIARPVGNQRSNWPYGAGAGWTRTLGQQAPAAYQLPFNPNTEIAYWDKLPYSPAQDRLANTRSPFLNK